MLERLGYRRTHTLYKANSVPRQKHRAILLIQRGSTMLPSPDSDNSLSISSGCDVLRHIRSATLSATEAVSMSSLVALPTT